MWSRKSKKWLLFGLQIVLMLSYFLPASLDFDLPVAVKVLGLVALVPGIAILTTALWQLRNFLSPFPAPRSHTQLVTKGIFKYSRHPVYTGLMLSFGGYACYSGDLSKMILSLLIVFFFYLKSGYEEQLLEERFSEYGNYKKRPVVSFNFHFKMKDI